MALQKKTAPKEREARATAIMLKHALRGVVLLALQLEELQLADDDENSPSASTAHAIAATTDHYADFIGGMICTDDIDD